MSATKMLSTLLLGIIGAIALMVIYVLLYIAFTR